jgi:hypothetical protein
MLNGDKSLRFSQQAEGVFIYPDSRLLEETDTIIELETK